ncbi:TVP38/TMEM64 family protein [Lusitaniella coriacea]|uniref:TVP38/TMEM64 family protein n=1 Tax=Lusitaniella coriacea TaxID=1983105 RepID=UPI003CF3B9D3
MRQWFEKLVKSPRGWFAIALLSCILHCFLVGPCPIFLNQDAIVAYLHQLGSWSIFAFIIAYIVLTLIGIPGTILTVAGGVVFGLVWGTVWSVIGATLGAIGAFLLARYFLHDWVQRQFCHHQMLERFEQAVTKMPLQFVLAIRFAPISPFNVVNFLFGLTPIQLKPYAIGTLLGIIPGTLAYTWLGVAGREALSGGNSTPLFLALGFLALLSLLPFFAKGKDARFQRGLSKDSTRVG